MSAASQVNQARRAAGLSQRELARKSGIPQSGIARIEGSHQVPTTVTLERLLRACGFELRLGPARGDSVDRSQIQEWIELSPAERLERATGYGRLVGRIRTATPIKPDRTS